MHSIWLSLKAEERGEKVKVLAVSLGLPSATRCAQTCSVPASASISPARRSASRHIALVTSKGRLDPALLTILWLTHCEG